MVISQKQFGFYLHRSLSIQSLREEGHGHRYRHDRGTKAVALKSPITDLHSGTKLASESSSKSATAATRKFFALAVLTLTFGAAQARIAPQNLMGTCNTEAAGKKGDERKAFMKTCLSDGKKRQQERMKACKCRCHRQEGR